jgi:hypothetical protein
VLSTNIRIQFLASLRDKNDAQDAGKKRIVHREQSAWNSERKKKLT